MSVVLASLAALCYGAADFSGGVATRRSPLQSVLIVSQAIGLVLAVAGSLLTGGALPSAGDFAWGAAAGLFGAAGLAFLYRALASTLVAVASPVAAVVGALLPVLAGFFLGERPSLLAWAGIALVVPAILLLTGGGERRESPLGAPGGPLAAAGAAGAAAPNAGGRERSTAAGPTGVRRAALLGAGAGIGFGLFYVAIARTSPTTGLWPLVAARATTVAAIALFAVATRRSLRPARGSLGATAAAGALDMGANIAFLLASRTGLLSIAAVVSSLYPAPTVVLARVVLRERLTPARWAGLAFAVAGVALISA